MALTRYKIFDKLKIKFKFIRMGMKCMGSMTFTVDFIFTLAKKAFRPQKAERFWVLRHLLSLATSHNFI